MARPLFRREDLGFAKTLDALCYENPFSSKRLELEQRALGPAFRDEPDAWSLGPGHENPNLDPLRARAGALLEQASGRLDDAGPEDFALFGSVVRFWLYYEFEEELLQLTQQARQGGFAKRRVALFRELEKTVRRFVPSEAHARELFGSVEHLFAIVFQLRRAFENLFSTIVGSSAAARELRASVWQSVFTHDMRRYERSLYRRMHEINTLVVGPSGTGKELVARAIGLSRYLPFDRRTLHFEEEVTDEFFALNVSALAATLVESELFGHKRGSFTGATTDRKGWLEGCPEHGTVFLDEIGELDPSIQVKLLRVLQTRELFRVGDSTVRRFAGKLITATNRDLQDEIQAGRFREDFYYRLCSDVIRTPSLAEQLAGTPDDLERLVRYVASRVVREDEVEALARETVAFIDAKLGRDYRWPGNVRELEQCVRSIVVRGRYEPSGLRVDTASRRTNRNQTPENSEAQSSEKSPAAAVEPGGPLGEVLADFAEARIDSERLLDVYCTVAYARTGSYSEAGRRVGLDRRTVRARIDEELLARLGG